MLSAKCGPAHIRMKYDPQAQTPIQFDEQIESRLSQKPVVINYDPDTDDELKKMVAEFEDKEMTVEDAEKARCNLCKKLFRGIEFTKKHLHNKHQDKITELQVKRFDKLTMEAYIKDPNKLTNPVNYTNDNFQGRGDFRRGGGRYPQQRDRAPAGPYEDLDDPSRMTGRRRQMVDYGDI
jgi:hypothetical protein